MSYEDRIGILSDLNTFKEYMKSNYNLDIDIY